MSVHPVYLHRVLLVDDQPLVGETLRQMLANESDIRLHCCHEPARAIHIANELKPTVILQDLIMPGIDGLTLVRYFRANASTRDVHLIVLSSKGEADIKAEALDLGANDYMVKFPDRIEVAARIRSHSKAYQDFLARQSVMEELAQAKRAADAASQAKSTFLANMSHELRTPLNGILGYAQILKHQANLNTQQQKGLEVIYQSGCHLLTLINDILDLSKIEAGKLALDPHEFALPPFLDSVVDLIRLRAEQKALSLNFIAAPDLPKHIVADDKRLRQILLNLLSNAVKFTDVGQIELRVQLRQRDERQATLFFSVQDSGVGIAKHELSTIFQAFEQVGEQHRKNEGTGLGLTICFQLLDAMGSELKVHSAEGKGSCFSFEITVKVVAKQVEQAPASLPQINDIDAIQAYQGHQRRILVVDDQEENRLVLQNMLTPLGFDVATVNNGAQCLSYVARHGVDLIFMDCRMPGLDGFETTAALRIDPHWQALPVIAVSTSALELDHNQSQNAVFNGFLAKPIKETELLSILADMLDLTWVYSQPAPDTAEKTAVVMPELNDLHTLLHLAELGKIPKIEAWVADLQHRQPACYQFAERIMRLTRQFDDEAICTLAQNAIQDHASNNEQ